MPITRRQFITGAAAAAGAAASLLTPPSNAAAIARPKGRGPFQPNWLSLSGQYQCPAWYRDAKFGIWAHWTAQCVPEQGDWYARYMYMQGHTMYQYHVKTYGHPSVFGFKDIAHLWQAENWDPDHLIKLYQAAGAQYFFALANGHDNFDTFNSAHQPWNSVNVGPKRDIVGGWSKAARSAGMPFGVSVHASHAWSFFETAQGADINGPSIGIPYDGKMTRAEGARQWWAGLDPQALYAQSHLPGTALNWEWNVASGSSVPDQAYIDKFYNRAIDLIEKYDPDLIYFDDTVMPLYPVSDIGLRLTSYYYNRNIERRNGRLEAAVFTKGLNDLQRRAVVWDIERGGSERMLPQPWQTDTCIGQWQYARSVYDQHAYKTPEYVIQTLVDVVSKNGNLLLSIPLRADGTPDSDEIKFLQAMAEWMPIGGEAIFGTRPWHVYGEGPSVAAPSHQSTSGYNENLQRRFTPQDIRFTTKADALYAIALAWPDSGVLTIKSLAAGSPYPVGKIRFVQLLGAPGQLQYTRTAQGLTINLPNAKPCDHAYAIKIDGAAA